MKQKIIKLLSLLCISLIFTSVSIAQDIEYYRAGEVSYSDSYQSTPSGKSFLWKIDTGSKPSYILGSMHFAKPQMYPLKPVINESFNASDVLVVEINILAQDPLKMQALLAKNGTYSNRQTLQDNLSSETLSLLNERLPSLGLDITAVSSYKPWYLALTLVSLDLMRLGFNPAYGLDLHFMQKAQGNKPIDQLESLQYQIDLFNDLSTYEQDLFLLSTLIDLKTTEKEIGSIIGSWESGDLEKMSSIMGKSLARNPELAPIYEKVIYKRNYEMADKIEALMQSSKSYFFIVGSAHLVGENGIIEILKRKGYSLQQL